MNDIAIRRARSGDEKKILKLVGDVLKSYNLKLNPRGEDLDITNIPKYYFENNGDFEVIEFNGDIIGSYGIYKINNDTCELRKMYLKENFQGLGLGNIMIENSFKLAKALNYKKIKLQTNSILYKGLKLYEKYGFENFKEEVCDRCDIAMVKEIVKDKSIIFKVKEGNYMYYETKIKGVKIRGAEEKDTKLILDLIMEMAKYERLSHEVVATEESISKSIFIKKRAEALILELDGKTIGYVIYFFNYSTFNGAAGLYLEDIYIKKEYRGMGIGKEIFKLLAKIAVEEDCKRIEWTCLNWNEPAKKFYKSMGAVPMNEWTVHRLIEKDIIELSKKS